MDINYLNINRVLLQFVADKLQRSGVRLLIVGEYQLRSQRSLSETERKLLDIRFNEDGVGDRIKWLQSCPPHFNDLYGELDYFSPLYIRSIFHPVKPVISSRGRINEPFRSRFVNIAGGYRLTTEQPDYYDHSIFVVGNSSVYGFGCEDKHTLPSWLQKLFNEHAALSKINYGVFNLGVRGKPPYLNFLTLFNLQCSPGDIVILQGVEHALIKFLCQFEDGKFELLIPDFADRMPKEEIFFDQGHVTYKGQQIAAKQIFNRLLEMLIKPINVASMPTYSCSELDEALHVAQTACATNIKPISKFSDHPDLQSYLDELTMFREPFKHCGAVVVNCNPFTLGHQYLVEYAANKVEHLYVFVVEENRSRFDFITRLALVKAGTQHLKNITVIRSGLFIMSALTCPEYFSKEDASDVEFDATSELSVFGEFIAPVLNITQRFIGGEPLCAINNQHNQQMRNLLPTFGIKVEEVPRICAEGSIISASRVRRSMQLGEWHEVVKLVPHTTANYLLSLCEDTLN
jgi:[citrate (pro-3S)-lyase] ligase